MIHVITGGSGSGKSRYAEQQILELGDNRRVYLATMCPYDEAVSYTHLDVYKRQVYLYRRAASFL